MTPDDLLPHRITDIPGPRSRALARELRRWESPNVTYVAPDGSFPVFWESGAGCLIRDVDGNRLLDLTAAFGVMALGHAHPAVAAAIADQAGRLVHGMGDVHPTGLKVQLLRRLAARTPAGLTRTLLGTSGGDAVEAAVKTARIHTGRPGVLAFTGGYHGLNLGALAVTHRDDFRAPFSGQVPAFAVHAPYGAPLERLPDDVGAVLVEPIQGRGGIVVPPPGWLTSLRALCDRHGALLVFDEIFTGLGRTGDWFAADHEGVVPDLICVGKALGGGMPISACVGRPDVMDSWGASTGEALHTSTFLGHPLACAAAVAALDALEAMDAPAAARRLGEHLRGGLDDLRGRHPDRVLEVRGRGLMQGIRLASRALCLDLVRRLLADGIVVLPAGDGDILEITPPLVVAPEQLDAALARIDAGLGAA